MIEGLVSIVMPAYNCEKYINVAIESVLNQTYENWELIIVDDYSCDGTFHVVSGYSDNRIIILKNNQNEGAALSRNKAIQIANGEYIAFLDSDDLWMSTKLEAQISFMKKNDFNFTSTYYDKIDENGLCLGYIVKEKYRRNYYGLLRNCPGNSTVIYNANKLGKFYISSIKKRNDYLMWLQVIKKSKELITLPQVLASHREMNGTLSSDKKQLIGYHWYIYRKIERLNMFISSYLICYWVYKTLKRKVLMKIC